MGQLCCPQDKEKNAPLLDGQNEEKSNTKATGSSVAVESTKSATLQAYRKQNSWYILEKAKNDNDYEYKA